MRRNNPVEPPVEPGVVMLPIKGYETRYWISDDGRVWSMHAGRWLKPQLAKRGKGYLLVGLWENNKEHKVYVHTLVGVAFVPNSEGKPTINHKDGLTTRNLWTNLEWATHQEQQDHAWETGLTNNAGENCGTVKLTLVEMEGIRARYTAGGITQQQLADEHTIHQSQVSRIIKGLHWKEGRNNART